MEEFGKSSAFSIQHLDMPKECYSSPPLSRTPTNGAPLLSTTHLLHGEQSPSTVGGSLLGVTTVHFEGHEMSRRDGL